MSRYFLDSSALAKRYLEERGTEWVLEITAPEAEHLIFVAQIAPVEIVTAITRRAHEGVLKKRTARAARLLIDRHARQQYQVIALTENVVRLAEDLLELHAPRAADAIQLASALEGGDRLAFGAHGRLEFVCGDARLLAAAASQGLATIDPNVRSCRTPR